MSFLEQVIWLYVGVIAALFGLVIIGSIFLTGQQQMNEQEVLSSLNKIKSKADFVCNSEFGTLLNENIVLASGSVLSISSQPNDSACVSFNGNTSCVNLSCNVALDYDLNLDSPEFKALFVTHKYECFFEKVDGGVIIECKG